MEKTTNKINIEETETPNLDKFEKKFNLYKWCFIGIIGVILAYGSELCFLLYPGIIPIIHNLSGISFFFFVFGIIIIGEMILIGSIVIQDKIWVYWILGYFLRKNSLAHNEYLKYLEQEQSKEVS